MSIDQDKLATPCMLIRPKVGFNPTMRARAAGRGLEPAVWEPVAAGHIPMAMGHR